MLRKFRWFLVITLALLVLFGAVFVAVQAQSETLAAAISQGFTYQGQLKKNASPYTGSCDFTFRLWDAAALGNQLGTSQSLAGVPVANGIFTVQLNGAGQFGVDAFNGNQRWLEINVQCTGDTLPVALGRQPITGAPYASYSANGDMLDGRHGSDFLRTIGGTLTGNLTLPKVIYATPRQHIASVSSEAFHPTSNVDYFNGGGQGGAYKPAGTGGVMAAAIQLPDGATVTKFRVYFWDNSPSQDLEISLDYQMSMAGGYGTLASVTTSGSSAAYTYLETTTISTPVIDNSDKGYLVWIYPLSTWNDANLRVKGASVYYTLSEAQ